MTTAFMLFAALIIAVITALVLTIGLAIEEFAFRLMEKRDQDNRIITVRRKKMK